MKKNHALEQLAASFQGIIQHEEQDLLQENANVDGRSPIGIMGKFSSVSAKLYALEYLLTEEVREAVQDNIIHVHDLDFYTARTTTCS